MWQRRIQQVVGAHKKLRLDIAGMRRSAVLVLLYPKGPGGGAPHLLLTKRTETVPQHKGQIAFPGGAQEHAGEGLLETALREAREEVGVAADGLEVMGELDDQWTVTNFVVTPFVAIAEKLPELRLNRDEISFALEIPLAQMLDRSRFREEAREWQGEPYTAYFFDYGEHVVWGLTARVLKQFLDLLDWRLE
ncbi:MAG: NUDIX hydrolase [Vicinamibacteria bacterium]